MGHLGKVPLILVIKLLSWSGVGVAVEFFQLITTPLISHDQEITFYGEGFRFGTTVQLLGVL